MINKQQNHLHERFAQLANAYEGIATAVKNEDFKGARKIVKTLGFDDEDTKRILRGEHEEGSRTIASIPPYLFAREYLLAAVSRSTKLGRDMLLERAKESIDLMETRMAGDERYEANRNRK